MIRTASQTDRAGRPAGIALAPRSRSFPADRRQVGSARRFLKDLLTGSPVTDDAVVLCLSEVTTGPARVGLG